MNVLLLVMQEQRALLDHFYAGIAANCDACDIRRLSDHEQADLKKYFAQQIDIARYDRIVIFIRCKKAFAQRRFFAEVPNLVFLDHDICQNYMDCKYRGEFSRLYRSVPWARIICSGASHTRRLRAEGFDAYFVPKGYDPKLIKNLQQTRTVELAFVGSTKNAIYRERKEFLTKFAQQEPIEIVRTDSGEDYVNKLNTIRYFLSVDAGMGEYMIKNFEAMACGCVLLAYDQGAEENAALGFVDMENIVLYRDIADLCEKLRLLRADSGLGDRIAHAGQTLAEQQYTFDRVGARAATALVSPLRARPNPPPSLWQSCKNVLQGFKQ